MPELRFNFACTAHPAANRRVLVGASLAEVIQRFVHLLLLSLLVHVHVHMLLSPSNDAYGKRSDGPGLLVYSSLHLLQPTRESSLLASRRLRGKLQQRRNLESRSRRLHDPGPKAAMYRRLALHTVLADLVLGLPIARTARSCNRWLPV